METASATMEDDSFGANPSSVKSDDSSPQHESGRGSPPPKCAICLGTCRNKSFTDSCLHQFCFKCLLTWSKVKAECPLCKQNFKSIIHNVRSNHQYEEYMVEQRQTEEAVNMAVNMRDVSIIPPRRFRYRTTLTLPRRETMAIQQLLLHYPLVTDVMPAAGARAPPTRAAPPARRRRSPDSFRSTVYRHNLWARPLPDFTGRFRDCSPEFYRYNDSQIHRLVPWLNRELHYLLYGNAGHISFVMARILELLSRYHISSSEFREAIQRYFGDRTEHFLHELYCFASTPYDITGYDRNVQYTTDTRISTVINEVISSSDSEASSDIVMVSSSEPAEPPAGPSRIPEPVYPQNYIPEPVYPQGYISAPASNNVIPIETISHSDTDDDSSEVMVVGYIKPPQNRTPEVVDLLGSDSDVIVQDNTQPEPSQEADTQKARPGTSLVKLSLKRQRSQGDESDSDASAPRATPGLRLRKRPPTPSWRPATNHSSSSSSTTSSSSSTTSSSSSTTFSSSPSSSNTSTVTFPSSLSDFSTDTDSSYNTKRAPKKKVRRKTHAKAKASKAKRSIEKDKKKSKRRTTTKHRENKKKTRSDRDKQSKRKSHSGKGVKSSKKTSVDSVVGSPGRSQVPNEQPGTSGVSDLVRHRSDRDRNRRRTCRESRKLRSVVNVMNAQKHSGDSNCSASSNLLNILSSAILDPNSNVLAYNSDSGSVPGDDRTARANNVPVDILQRAESCFVVDPPPAARDFSSDDDRPLNLTLKKPLL